MAVNLKPKPRSMRQAYNEWTSPNNFFKLGMYTRNFGVVPVVCLAFLDCMWMAFCTIKGFSRTEIVLSRNGIKSKRQGQLTELLIHPVNRKFLTFEQTFEPQPELYEAYEEMRKAEEELNKGK